MLYTPGVCKKNIFYPTKALLMVTHPLHHNLMIRSPSSGGRRRHRAVSGKKEVDAIENPTELFQRINSGDWDGALLTVYRAPAEASIWVSRWSKRNNKVAWTYLPLHLVCLHRQPPWPLLQALLQANPQAASTPTPHDGNLPIHYICESGCDDVNILGSLITAFPQCMSAMNGNNKNPMMICHPRTRNVLKKVLKQILPSHLAKLSMETSRNSPLGKDRRSGVDERNVSDFSSRDTILSSAQYHEPRQLPDDTNKNYTRPPILQMESPEHRSMNNFTYSLSSDDNDISSSQSSSTFSRYFNAMQSPKHGEQSSTWTNGETKQNPDKEENHLTISELTGQLQNSSFAKESSDLKLCERILAKAESESVELRAQIRQLQTEKNKLEEEVKLKENSMEENLNILTKALTEQEHKSKISLFQRKDESININLVCITEAVLRLLSQVELQNESFREQMISLQTQLSETEVKHKSVLANNLVLQHEKCSITDERDNLESLVTTLEDERESLKKELSHEKERTSSLRVINHSLQEQIDAAIGELPGNEKNLRAQLRYLSTELLKMKDDQTNSVESQRYQKQITSLLEDKKSLLEKNQTLKETIRENNELYSKKIMELEKKFEAIEQHNEVLRLHAKVETTENREGV
jgi:hypothetical protein